MNEVNRTLFIPLYGKAWASRQGILLKDPAAERIWEKEGFPLGGKSASTWLACNMAMRSRVFDDWTEEILRRNPEAIVLHIGCGLDSRCERVRAACAEWVDMDLPDVIEVRKKYFKESGRYRMQALDASDPEALRGLPERDCACVILEGLSMYLTNSQVRGLLAALEEKYRHLHVLMDVYTVFGAKASRFKNPVNEVGVTRLYGIDDMDALLSGLRIRKTAEHTFTPERLVNELPPVRRFFFRWMFTGKLYGKIYRLYELEA